MNLSLKKKHNFLRIMHKEQKMLDDHLLLSFDIEKILEKPDFFKIVFIKDGNLTIKIDHATIFIGTPYVLCIDAKSEITILSTYNLNTCIIMFKPQFINKTLTNKNIRESFYHDMVKRNEFPDFSIFHNKNDLYSGVLLIECFFEDPLNRLCDMMFNTSFENYSKTCYLRTILLQILNLLNLILKRYLKILSAYTPLDTDIQKAVDYIGIYFDTKITLNDLCKVSNLNRNRLNKKFYTFFGVTTNKYLTGYRINFAKQLLSTTSLSIEAIAKKCGFEYSSYFVSVFRNTERITPTTFRKNSYLQRRDFKKNQE